jgi:pantoate--beta-alanine ligase
MIIAKTKYQLNEALGQISLSPGKLALVPTMGNLHQGHLSLVKLAKLNSSKTITTIFVNPLQFGKNDDFDNYPRTIEQDIKKLNDENCDILFLPKSRNEMFPDETEIQLIKSGSLGKELCGKLRPDHFDGVLTVVHRMFNIIKPDIAVFGAKDYQQQILIRNMSKSYFPNLNILTAPIVRSNNGLALSSRNNYLSNEELDLASNLFKCLKKSVDLYQLGESIEVIIKTAKEFLISINLVPDYYEIRDELLSPIFNSDQVGKKVILGSLKIGNTRIIDNIEFNS